MTSDTLGTKINAFHQDYNEIAQTLIASIEANAEHPNFQRNYRQKVIPVNFSCDEKYASIASRIIALALDALNTDNTYSLKSYERHVPPIGMSPRGNGRYVIDDYDAITVRKPVLYNPYTQNNKGDTVGVPAFLLPDKNLLQVFFINLAKTFKVINMADPTNESALAGYNAAIDLSEGFSSRYGTLYHELLATLKAEHKDRKKAAAQKIADDRGAQERNFQQRAMEARDAKRTGIC